MYQKMVIAGNLGRDPEMRYTPSGQAVTNLNVATNRQYTSNSGEKVKETTWFPFQFGENRQNLAINICEKAPRFSLKGA